MNQHVPTATSARPTVEEDFARTLTPLVNAFCKKRAPGGIADAPGLLRRLAATFEAAAVVVPIEREPVRSSNLATVGYDPDSLTLEIEFRSGSVYRYDAVPADFWEAFRNAPSPGSFFATHIRPQFKARRVS